ncbi:transmembrane protein 116 isoform X2 [Microcaecilia unicolor]|uniref:Transmembrane protein 116 isoform X2 n=1 Tax=Microcaecilia unicolor TaxID=1415580 RepID=A0A6P7Z8D1_9AMPH|nr:transmembrane protein 116 isoform X2 [Microcaecilia unicolor]
MYRIYSAIEWIQFFTATMSIIGSSSIMAYAVFQNLLRSPEVRPLFYLSFFNLWLGLCWLTGSVLYRHALKNQNVACYNLQITGQLFYIASFFYTVNYAWHLYIDLKGKMYSMSHWATEYAYRVGRIGTILSGLLPLVLVIPVLSLGNYTECYSNFNQSHRCLLLHTGVPNPNSSICTGLYFYGSGVFQVTFLVTVIATVVLLLKACVLYKKYTSCLTSVSDQKWAVISVAKQRMVLYPVVFFICWTPAAVLSTSKLIDPEEHTDFHIILSFLQALTAVSQGLLNCLVYGRTQQMLSYKKQVTRCDEATQTLLSRQQKKFYASIQPTTTCADSATSTGL